MSSPPDGGFRGGSSIILIFIIVVNAYRLFVQYRYLFVTVGSIWETCIAGLQIDDFSVIFINRHDCLLLSCNSALNIYLYLSEQGKRFCTVQFNFVCDHTALFNDCAVPCTSNAMWCTPQWMVTCPALDVKITILRRIWRIWYGWWFTHFMTYLHPLQHL